MTVANDVKTLEEQIATLQDELADAENTINELKEAKDSGDLEAAIHAVLDLVERPVGSLAATLPASAAASRALIALHDAVGRNL